MTPRPTLCALVLTAAAAPMALAQTGPWTDGELLARTYLVPSNELAIVRVAPDTGAAAVLVKPLYWGGWSGSMVFDSYRGGLLANMSLPPDSTFLYRLWVVDHDGSAVAMPGFSGSLRALAPAGDGRVYFIRQTGLPGGETVEYFDASDQIRTLVQSDGVTPFEIETEHLRYHAPTNSLIASLSLAWSPAQCGGGQGPSLFRIPLSADGSRVAGPVTCVAVPHTMAYGYLMGLDHLPDGRVLVPTATPYPGAPHDLLAFDPATMALSTWAVPLQADVDGGLWSSRIGRAVLHTTSFGIPNGLYSFQPGSAGEGTFIATSVAVPNGDGFHPADTLAEVDVNGPACDGFQLGYGAGLPGAGFIEPLIGAIGCPDVGNPFTLSISAVVGGAPGLLAVGASSLALPAFGGTLLVLPAATVPIAVSGPLGLAGAGGLALPIAFTDPAMVGVDLYLQAAFLDVNAVQGISLTRGLRLQPG